MRHVTTHISCAWRNVSANAFAGTPRRTVILSRIVRPESAYTSYPNNTCRDENLRKDRNHIVRVKDCRAAESGLQALDYITYLCFALDLNEQKRASFITNIRIIQWNTAAA